MRDLLYVSSHLFEIWNKENVNYCHWKSNEHLIPGINGDTDLDILVCKEDLIKVRQIMTEQGFIRFESQYGAKYRDIEDWIGFDDNTGKIIHIHLHTRLATGHKGMKEFSLPWIKEALSTRILDPETKIYVMNPNLELVTLYVRICLKTKFQQIIKYRINKKYAFSKDVVSEINYLKQRIDYEKVYEILKVYFNDADSILKAIKKDTLGANEFLKLRSLILDSMCICRDNGKFLSTIKEMYFFVELKLRSFLRKKTKTVFIYRKVPIGKKGLTVAFIGQDGAGKSTITQEIEKWLSWKIDARRFYLGSGDHYKSWRKLVINRLRRMKGNPFAKTICAMLIMRDYCNLNKKNYKTIIKAEKFKNMGGVVLYDRFPQSQLAGLNDGPKIRSNFMSRVDNSLLKMNMSFFAKKEEKWIKKAETNKPMVVFKLMLSPEESIRRKPEENFEIVQKKHEFIKQWDIGTSTYEISAEQKYSDEIVEIKRIIWRELLAQQ